jgi:hypothetical protein
MNSSLASDDDSFARDLVTSPFRATLPESLVESSQDFSCHFILDEVVNEIVLPPFIVEADESVELLGESGNVLVDFIHARPDCVTHLFKDDCHKHSLKHCPKCCCLLCQDLVPNCIDWSAHCIITINSEEYKDAHTTAARQNEQQQLSAGATDLSEAEPTVLEEKKHSSEQHLLDCNLHDDLEQQIQSLHVELSLSKEKIATLEAEKKSVEASLSQKMVETEAGSIALSKIEFINDLLKLDKDSLKKLCEKEKINLKGNSSKEKNNYIVKLLVSALK